MTDSIIRNFKELEVGQTSSFIKVISEQDIQTFATLTGDVNPLHLDEGFARQFNYRGPVVYGMLSASFISTLIGNFLPGPGSLWLSQTLDFVETVYVGEELKVVGTIKQKSESTRLIVLETVIYGTKGTIKIRGESRVKLLQASEGGQILERSKKKVALVLGASGGIGSEIAKLIASNDYKVYIHFNQDGLKAKSVLDEISSIGDEGVLVQADLSKSHEIETMMQTILNSEDTIDALIHCASPENPPKAFLDLSWEDIQTQLDVNIKASFLVLKLVLPRMVEQGEGNVIFIGSAFTSSTPPSQQSRYIMAKSTLVSMVKCLAVEFGPKNLRFLVVSPGMTETKMIENLPEKTKLMAKMQTPLRKLAKPKDIAGLVLFLLSDQASHITGQDFRVDGGLVMD